MTTEDEEAEVIIKPLREVSYDVIYDALMCNDILGTKSVLYFEILLGCVSIFCIAICYDIMLPEFEK